MQTRTHDTATPLELHAYPSHLARAIDLRSTPMLQVRAARTPIEALSVSCAKDTDAGAPALRFQGNANGLPQQLAPHITCIDIAHQMGFVVTRRQGDADHLIADACLALSDDNDIAEFAVTVATAWRGRGLGMQLLGALIHAARHIGVQRLHGELMADNRAMLALLLRCGFTVRPHPIDACLVRVERDLTPPSSSFRFARRHTHLLDTFRHALPQLLMPMHAAA
ncbi:hypothetical protein GCM10025771_30810 [Niveibacterium umoris]|uniref:Acetyltransferase n=1 Tax=Niveibacterium umoris TaxID=1193620 RepID=A0A840BLF8_9RHOO|nr:GNAT family N-acetyltransferase [Niveibacterium umoris]MBB4011726.1 acetyltransferase [Niveibacterium umoris]